MRKSTYCFAFNGTTSLLCPLRFTLRLSSCWWPLNEHKLLLYCVQIFSIHSYNCAGDCYFSRYSVSIRFIWFRNESLHFNRPQNNYRIGLLHSWRRRQSSPIYMYTREGKLPGVLQCSSSSSRTSIVSVNYIVSTLLLLTIRGLLSERIKDDSKNLPDWIFPRKSKKRINLSTLVS